MATTDGVKVRIIDQAEGMSILEEAARKYLGISAEEFLALNGEYVGKADTPAVTNVYSLIHLDQ